MRSRCSSGSLGILGKAVSESGRLRHGDGTHGSGDRLRRPWTSGNPVQIPDSHSIPHRFPANFHALPSVEWLWGRDEIGAAIQTTSTSKVKRVDFGDCGPVI